MIELQGCSSVRVRKNPGRTVRHAAEGAEVNDSRDATDWKFQGGRQITVLSAVVYKLNSSVQLRPPATPGPQ